MPGEYLDEEVKEHEALVKAMRERHEAKRKPAIEKHEAAMQAMKIVDGKKLNNIKENEEEEIS
jgi:hypothetical protein